MVFLGNLQRVTDTKYRVAFTHSMPFDVVEGMGKTQEELAQIGILVDEIFSPEQIIGKSSAMFVNPVTKEITYEYEDIPLTTEQQIAQLQQQVNDLTLAVVNIVGGVVSESKTASDIIQEYANSIEIPSNLPT